MVVWVFVLNGTKIGIISLKSREINYFAERNLKILGGYLKRTVRTLKFMGYHSATKYKFDLYTFIVYYSIRRWYVCGTPNASMKSLTDGCPKNILKRLKFFIFVNKIVQFSVKPKRCSIHNQNFDTFLDF